VSPRARFSALVFSFLLNLALAWPAAGQQAASSPRTVTSWAAEQAAAVSEADVNGMKLLFKRRPGSSTVTAGIFIRGGSAGLTAENAGIEALLLRVMAEGSATWPRARLQKELARMATTISSGTNPDYSVLTMVSTRGSFDASWDIFTDLFLRPALLPADLDRERRQLIASLKNAEAVPDSALELQFERALFAGHPYANPPDGTAESLNKLTPLDLRRHHQQILSGSRLLLVIVGDLDPAQVGLRVGTTFSKLPRGSYRPPEIPPFSIAAAFDAASRELPLNYVMGAFASPPLSAPDYPALRIAVTILRERFFEEVRVKRSLAYSVEASLEQRAAPYGTVYVAAQNVNQAVAIMRFEMGRMQTEQVTSAEIRSAVAVWTTGYFMNAQTNAAQAGELARFELIGGSWRNAFAFVEQLKKVTPADVQRAAIASFKNVRFVGLGNPAQMNREVFTGP
jgi:predicted Zn-dependent peptidase